MQENKLKNYLHLHLIVFIWGFTAILGELISIEAVPLVWFRMFLAVIFILCYFLIKRENLKIDTKAIFKFFFSGVIIAIHWITFFKAIKVSNVSVTLVTMSTGAFFASIIEPLIFRKKIQPLEIFMGLLVILGLYIIFNFEGQYIWGIVFALISAFSSALFSVLNGLYIKKHKATVISFYQLLFGGIGVTIFLFFSNQFTNNFFYLKGSDWFYLVLLSSICTSYAFIASVKVMKYLTPYTVMLTINLEPIYGIILALLVLGEKEQMNPEFYYGALIVLLVVILNGVIKNKSVLIRKISIKKSLK
ncbi:DMT family transporter [Tenacibaculum sp. C7A-26P2]|uniref:DMT family transporter n=1 Tax=Tenacibaculum sp. C7A-26P2 TaxID=3447504 RepID=UPI003F86B78A